MANGIQIPQLQRFAPQAPQSSGRIDTNVPQQGEATRAITGSVSTFVEQVNDYQIKVEDAHNKTKGKEMVLEVDSWAREQLASLNKMQGDPSPMYADYDKRLKDKIQEVIDKYPDASAKLKHEFQNQLEARMYLLEERRATQQGRQGVEWAVRVEEADSELRAQRLYDQAAKAKVSRDKNGQLVYDEKSFEGLDDELAEFVIARQNRGIQLGTIVRNEDGSLNKSDVAKADILKSTSKKLSSLIDAYNNLETPNSDMAEALMKRYGGHLTLEDRNRLKKSGEEAKIKREAIITVDHIMSTHKGVEAQGAAIDRIKNPILKNKAEEIYNAKLNRKENQDKAREAEIQKDMLRVVTQIKAKNPGATLDDLRANPEFQKLSTYAKDRKTTDAAEAVFSPPKISSPNARSKMLNAVSDGSYRTMDDAAFTRLLDGLSGSDQNKLITRRAQALDVNEAEKHKKIEFGSKELKMMLEARADEMGLERDFNGVKIDPLIFDEWRTEFLDELDTQPKESEVFKDSQKMRKAVREFVANKQKGAAFGERISKPQKFNSGGGVIGTWDEPAKTPKKELSPMTPELRKKLRAKWNRLFPKEPFEAGKHSLEKFRQEYGDD